MDCAFRRRRSARASTTARRRPNGLRTATSARTCPRRTCRDIRARLRPCRGSVWSWLQSGRLPVAPPCAGSSSRPQTPRIFRVIYGPKGAGVRRPPSRIRKRAMTAIRGYVPPTTERDAVGVHSLDQFVLSVPDLKPAQHFYINFGLDVREDDNRLLLHTV